MGTSKEVQDMQSRIVALETMLKKRIATKESDIVKPLMERTIQKK
jgi:hypothetical protein